MVVGWSVSNRSTFERAVLISYQATEIFNNVSWLLSEYMKACVQASCNTRLSQAVSLVPISFVHLRQNLWFLPYHVLVHLHPALGALIQERDMRRAEAGLLTPVGSKAMRIQLAVAGEVAQTSGDRGGGVDGGGRVRGLRLQRNDNADAGGGTRHGRKGAPIANPICIPVLNLWAGENMWDVL